MVVLLVKVVAAVETATQCDILKMEEPGGSVIIVTDDNSRSCLFRKVVESGVPETKTELSDFDEELIGDVAKEGFPAGKFHSSGTFLEDREFVNGDVGIGAAVQCDIMKIKGDGDDEMVEVEVVDENLTIRYFRKIVSSGNTSSQTDFSEFDDDVDKTETSVQCNIMEKKARDGEEIIEIVDEGFGTYCFVSEQNKRVAAEHDASVQTDFQEFGEELDKNETETSVQCEIMKTKTCNDVETVEIFDENSKCWRFRKVLESRDIAVQSEAVGHTTQVLPGTRSRLVTEENLVGKLGVHDHVEVLGIDLGVQCNIMEIKYLDDKEFLNVLHESGIWRFKKVAESCDSDAQTDFVEFQTLNDDVDGEKASERDEENVEEKHVGEKSEKSLVCAEKSWKDFVVERDLRGVTTPLDCVVYEKEDVLVVICESSRRLYREVPNSVAHVHGQQVLLCNGNDDIFAKNESSKDEVRKDVVKVEVGVQCNMLEEVACHQLLVTEATDRPVDASAKSSSLASSPGFYPNYTKDFEQSAFHPGGADVTQVTQEQNRRCSAEVDLLNDLHCDHPELVRPLTQPERHPPFEKTANGVYRYQSSNSIRDISTQCPDDSEGTQMTQTSCLYCGHAKLPAVDCGVQCEFADLLCSVSGITDLSDMTDIPSIFQETGDDSLMKEVMELAKECNQNDALIDQHLNDVVQSQECYEEFQEEFQEEEEAIDVGVQCDILTTPALCDQETQCMMDGSDVDILVTVERGDKEVPSEFYENNDQEFKNVESEQVFGLERLKAVDEEEEFCGENAGDIEEKKDQLVYRDLYSEISNSEARDEILDLDNMSMNCSGNSENSYDEILDLDNISMNCSGNSENSYDEITAGKKREGMRKVDKDKEFCENLDKAVQCNLLDVSQGSVLKCLYEVKIKFVLFEKNKGISSTVFPYLTSWLRY